ncbi:hypothetical protein QQS21_001205 [Conoideocrella luteorostrata]|uniref:Uncharacterized protein n=1 Tax=Conoideocrella luteorostrata TaxID=1105319 RepID=A0AAJ0CZZ7_9HYPO|nr:hypothetical protein QQS21_001205 [Conoideocrella luteorostrata]
MFAELQESRLIVAFKIAFSVYIVLQVVLLALWASSAAPTTKATLATVSLTITGFTFLVYVSHLEHTRSLRPSTPITIYLGVSILLDLARVRTLFFIPGSGTVARVYLASFCVKFVIFVLELTEKRQLLLSAWQNASPEAVGSVYNRVLFLWLNSLFLKGFRNLISINSLPTLDTELLNTAKPTELAQKWNRSAFDTPAQRLI